MNVIGIARKSGEYQGKNYDNFVFYCAYPAESKNSVGQITEAVKVNRNRILNGECFGNALTDDDVYSLVGENLSFGYDKYANVNFIRVIETERKAVAY